MSRPSTLTSNGTWNNSFAVSQNETAALFGSLPVNGELYLLGDSTSVKHNTKATHQRSHFLSARKREARAPRKGTKRTLVQYPVAEETPEIVSPL